MTIYTIRIDRPFQAIVQGDHENRWSVTDRGTLTDDQVVLLEGEILPFLAETGPDPGGLPRDAGYPQGILRGYDGEVLSVDPPIESVPGRIY